MASYEPCDSCGTLDHLDRDHLCIDCRVGEPNDNEIANRPGVEGGIGYPLEYDGPGSLGENDWRL